MDSQRENSLRLLAENCVNFDAELLALLDKVYSEKGWDFRNYKMSSVKRRVMKRLNARNVSSCADYLEVLDSDKAEYARFFSSLTIKVSEFFREPEAFSALEAAMASFYRRYEGLRVWSCGAAYGEEAYTLAIILSEFLSPGALERTRIFATDIDGAALDCARKARYRDESLRNVSTERRRAYFEEEEGVFKVRFGIRNLVKFGCLDIVSHSPLLKIDVLACRNVFIYFNKRLQEEVFWKIDYALNPGGVLMMGKAEAIPSSFAYGYERLAACTNIYRKRDRR